MIFIFIFLGIFGTDLTTSLKNEPSIGKQVPNVVLDCIAEIEARGLTAEGIYRVSGSQESVEQLKLAFERGLFIFCL